MALVADENIWLTQKSICSLYDVAKSTVSYRLTNIFESGELDQNSVVRKFRTTAADGKMYNQDYNNLQASGSELLSDAGKVSALEAKIHAEGEFEKYRVIQDKMFSSDFDKFLEENDISNLAPDDIKKKPTPDRLEQKPIQINLC